LECMSRRSSIVVGAVLQLRDRWPGAKLGKSGPRGERRRASRAT
jgi:hypothetical protein